ncbi:hypothetical protein T492DRAFT_864940, partial [Pavlovales sp. CCMP2436]
KADRANARTLSEVEAQLIEAARRGGKVAPTAVAVLLASGRTGAGVAELLECAGGARRSSAVP